MPAHFLFDNPLALHSYINGEMPAIDTIHRGLFVEDWRNAPNTPDHYLKNRRTFVLSRDGDQTANSNTSLADTLLHVFHYLGHRYLEWTNGRLHVRENLFGEWQDLLPSVSPLLLQAYMVYVKAGPPPSSPPRRKEYIEKWLRPNFAATALPYPANPLLEGLIRREGLIEIHCHLNGSTECDYVWLDAVSEPVRFYQRINEPWQAGTWAGQYVREQIDQIEPGLSPFHIWQRLWASRTLRMQISKCLFREASPTANVLPLTLPVVAAITGGHADSKIVCKTPLHPATDSLWRADAYGELVLEAGFLTALFERLENDGEEALAHAFYFTLLTNALISKLTVQQIDQFGFDQFQKITLNEARTLSEKEYQRRFHQMDTTANGDIRHFEGRFAPKPSPAELRQLMQRIDKGFNAFKKHTLNTNRMELGLVCHFIKKPEDLQPAGCRQYRLRSSLTKAARAITATCDPARAPRLHQLLVGIDAASNELQTPPEVFASLYRAFRRVGQHQFTYHVGEDFVHLLSGIRAVHEAVRFLELCPGNRIGHGTAIGIEPVLWCKRVGDTVYLARGEHLDNLVFAYYRLMELPGLQHLTTHLADAIAELSREIYGDVFLPCDLWQAWALRNIDPLLAFNPYRQVHLLDPREREEELDLLKVRDRYPESWYLYKYYHGQVTDLAQVLKKWEQTIRVPSDIVPPEALRQLQEQELTQLVARRIAIESMPTSNLRIGFYRDLSEHHIFRWLGISSEKGVRPFVCLGSDDPGIFATSIRAEYCHVYRVLVERFEKPPTEALKVLDDLLRNADTFRFTPPLFLSPPPHSADPTRTYS